MKTLHITPQKVVSLLKTQTEFPFKYVNLLVVKKFIAEGNEIHLNSGARLCFNPSLVNYTVHNEINGAVKSMPSSGWFIHGYCDDSSDVDCYFNKKLYLRMVKEKRILVRAKENVGVIYVTSCSDCPYLENGLTIIKRCIHPDHIDENGFGVTILNSEYIKFKRRASFCTLETLIK